jgi:hypothetical protein
MHAQVTTVEASPARLDDAIRFFREQVLPQLRQMDGFEEFIALSDRQSGKLDVCCQVHAHNSLMRP